MGPFVPEFIIPQLLLQWVAQEEQIDGIRYFSVRLLQKDIIFSHIPTVFFL